VFVAQDDIAMLAERGLTTARKTIRLCTHENEQSALHEMFIVHASSTFVFPHKHDHKTESALLLDGLMDVVMFDIDGNITRAVRMGDYGSGLPFYIRIPSGVFHAMIARSDRIVYKEATTGPFRRDDFIVAPFATHLTTPEAQLQFKEQLALRAENLVTAG
jgi:cupin fold WbuC family metalloprotein